MSEQKLVYFSSKNQDLSSDRQTIKHRSGSHWTVEKDWAALTTMEEVNLKRNCNEVTKLTLSGH